MRLALLTTVPRAPADGLGAGCRSAAADGSPRATRQPPGSPRRARRGSSARAHSAAADAVARRHGGRRIGTGAYAVAKGRARELAAALRARGLLLYAEPDRLAERLQNPPPDPLDVQASWRAAIIDPGLVPPP